MIGELNFHDGSSIPHEKSSTPGSIWLNESHHDDHECTIELIIFLRSYVSKNSFRFLKYNLETGGRMVKLHKNDLNGTLSKFTTRFIH